MNRRVISMLAAVSLLATVSAPGAVVYAEGDLDMVVSTDSTLQNKGDGGSSTLDQIINSNASIMGALGNTSWAVRAESVEKTGKWRDDLVAVAQTQTGYVQAADGSTIYGEWIGAEAGSAWDAQFVSWVADKAGLTEKQFPHGASYDALVNSLTKYGAVKQISKANYPNTGDIALLEIGGVKCVGIIVYVNGGYAAVVRGNDAGAVTRDTYMIDGAEFQSYADMNVLMAHAGLTVSKGDEVTIPEGGVAAWTNTDSVYMREKPTTTSKKITMVNKSGTALLVTSAEKQEDGYVWYGVTYKNHKGFIRGDLVKLDVIEQPSATTAPAPACVICGANGEIENCLYAELAGKSAQESYAFLQNLLENDRAAFDQYVKCHSAHVAAGAPAVICGNGCEQTLTNLAVPGAAHSRNCPWHADGQLGVQERIVNIEVIQVENGQSVNIKFEVYGATAYQWVKITETATDTSEWNVENTNADPSVLTVKVDSTEKQLHSYYCIATLADGSTVTSKITRIVVAEAPIVAEAILGEEVKFTYTVNNATAYQWYVDGVAIADDDLTYIGAKSAMLCFYATGDKVGKQFTCVATVDGKTTTSTGYSYTIIELDLCKYVEELANMAPSERSAALNVTWNITLNGKNLADEVENHWLNCENGHRSTYPDLFEVDDVTAESNGNVRPKEEGTVDFNAFLDCNKFPAECALIQSWIENNASPTTIYADMQSIMTAPGYTADGKKYDRLFALMMHVYGHYDEMRALMCTCDVTDTIDDWHPRAPGAGHAANCPWHIEQGLHDVCDANGELLYQSLMLTDESGNLVEIARAEKHPLDPDHFYLKDMKSGLYVAYVDENGNIIPLESDRTNN